MRLSDILENTGCRIVAGDAGTDISSVEYDSRKITRGSMFVAIKASRQTAMIMSNPACQTAARLRFWYRRTTAGWMILPSELCLRRPDVLLSLPQIPPTLAQVTAAISGHPEEKLRICGITGARARRRQHLCSGRFSSGPN